MQQQNSSEFDDMLHPILNTLKRDLKERVMQELHNLLNTGNQEAADTGDSSGQSYWSDNSNLFPASGTSGRPRGKRALESGDGNPGEDDNDDDPSERPKKRPIISTEARDRPKFACPFFKRDKSKHLRWRSCAGPGWATVHRVKEHVYRRHHQPIFCPRCYAVFDDEEGSNEHMRMNPPCETVENPAEQIVEGFNKDQEKKLRSRKRNAAQSERDRWIEMYKILFPDDEESSIPEPCK
jgi:hypothetical protein